MCHLLALARARLVFFVFAQDAHFVAHGDQLGFEGVGAEFDDVEFEGEGDFAHDLGFLLGFAFPEEAHEVHGQVFREARDSRCFGVGRVVVEDGGALFDFLGEGGEDAVAEVVGVFVDVAVQLEEGFGGLDFLLAGFGSGFVVAGQGCFEAAC